MKRPAVFFDRDNTLIACDEYLGDANKVCLVDGAADAVARARQLGYSTVIFSNQSGVARGYFSEEAVHAVNQRLDEMLAEKNPKAVIDRHEFCPFHPDASIEKYRQNSALRKPSPGMIHSAAEALALDLERSWVIGDAPRDVEAGHAAGCRTILFTDPSLKSSPATLVNTKVEPDYVCSTLKEAMDYIEKNTERPPDVEQPAPPPPTSITTVASVGATPAPPGSADNEGDAGVAPTEKPAPTSQPSIAKVLAQSQPHSTARLESLVNELVQEIRRQREVPHNDFSVSKLMAGVTQILVLAILFMSFLNRNDLKSLVPLMIFALTLQTMTISLLIMGRQK